MILLRSSFSVWKLSASLFEVYIAVGTFNKKRLKLNNRTSTKFDKRSKRCELDISISFYATQSQIFKCAVSEFQFYYIFLQLYCHSGTCFFPVFKGK